MAIHCKRTFQWSPIFHEGVGDAKIPYFPFPVAYLLNLIVIFVPSPKLILFRFFLSQVDSVTFGQRIPEGGVRHFILDRCLNG